MFNPSQADVRGFFVEARRKRRAGGLLSPLEIMAADWSDGHPEYDEALADVAAAQAAGNDTASGRENPFLHLSMHLSISEQVAIDQPAGIRAAFLRLAERLGSQHAAHHEVMECLGTLLWDSQRGGLPPDGEAYVECVRRRATR